MTLGCCASLARVSRCVGSDFLGFVGMDADGGVDPVVGFGVGHGGIELFRAGTRADGEDCVHPGGAGALEHGVAVVSELREVDVGVGVDQFHALSAR